MKKRTENLFYYFLSAVLLSTTACATSRTAVYTAAPATAATAAAAPAAQQSRVAVEVKLPNKKDSLRFAVIGDSGTGGTRALEVAAAMAAYHKEFSFEFVLMLGDNMYGSERPSDYEKKFERPFKPLLDAGVKFYAALGNHDDTAQRFYKNFNMGGERYYTFSKDHSARFFALDSNYMDRAQIEWLEKQLKDSGSKWKIAFFHHPPYSSGERHGPEVEVRKVVEPLFMKYGVSAVFSGHEHFYERLKPQNGIYYIIQGAASKLRRRNIRTTGMTAKGFDTDYSFTMVEIDGETMWIQTVTRNGATVDFAGLHRIIPAAEVAGRGNSAPKQ